MICKCALLVELGERAASTIPRASSDCRADLERERTSRSVFLATSVSLIWVYRAHRLAALASSFEKRVAIRLPARLLAGFETELLCMVFAMLASEPLRRGVPTGSSDFLTGDSISGSDGPRADGAMSDMVSEPDATRMKKCAVFSAQKKCSEGKQARREMQVK